MEVTPPCHSLFVYGTLRRDCGHPMARFLAERGVYCGEGKVLGRLFDLGRYPAAVPSNDAGEWVFGDIYEIDDATLKALDDYEGVESPQPSYFARQVVDIVLANGNSYAAWVYWFFGPLPSSAVRIDSGQYEKKFSVAGEPGA